MRVMLTRPIGQSAALFRALVEHSSDAIALLDEGGCIVYLSPAAERLGGYAPEERIGRPAFELVHEEDLARVRDTFTRGLASPGVPLTCEFRARHKDGTWRRFEGVAVNHLADPEVMGVVVNYRDVTERWETERRLRENDDRLRHLFASAPDIIYYCSADGRFTYVNPTASRVMQYDERELIGRHFLTLIHPDYQEVVAEHYRKQMAERTPDTYFEFPAVAKDGTPLWLGQHVQLVMTDGAIAGVQAIARDISKQKDAEDRLRQSEAQYRSLIEEAEYGIYVTDYAGVIHAANPAMARMLGYDSVDELRRGTMNDIYLSSESRTEIVDRYIGSGRERLTGNVRWRKKDGSIITVRVTGRRVNLGNGRIGFQAIAEDITARRALEQQLRQAQKMEAVGLLARGVAHDFNNVLTAILGCSELMLLRLDPADPLRADAQEISKAAHRGAALTRQLLAFSRRQQAEPQLLNVHTVLTTLDSMLRRLSGDIELRLHTPGEAPLVRMDPGQLEQIVMNLVLNARDALPGTGTIDVVADVVSLDGGSVVRYPTMPPGKYAHISVHDTGHGIPPEVQSHVFEPFFTTKDASKGTGLGLSIVYGIVKEAHGTVVFTSTADVGTTFDVLLPLASDSSRTTFP